MTVNVNVQVVANISGLTVHVIIDVTGVYHVMYVGVLDVGEEHNRSHTQTHTEVHTHTHTHTGAHTQTHTGAH